MGIPKISHDDDFEDEKTVVNPHPAANFAREEVPTARRIRLDDEVTKIQPAIPPSEAKPAEARPSARPSQLDPAWTARETRPMLPWLVVGASLFLFADVVCIAFVIARSMAH